LQAAGHSRTVMGWRRIPRNSLALRLPLVIGGILQLKHFGCQKIELAPAFNARMLARTKASIETVSTLRRSRLPVSVVSPSSKSFTGTNSSRSVGLSTQSPRYSRLAFQDDHEFSQGNSDEPLPDGGGFRPLRIRRSGCWPATFDEDFLFPAKGVGSKSPLHHCLTWT
jgi:hypothetical protein